MSTGDFIMPHRLLINKSLRKVSQELRDRVEVYQVEFNRRLEECKADLQRAEENKNKELEAFRTDLLRELNDDLQILEEIQGNILKYIDCFFYRAYLSQLLEINQRRNDILHEDYVFLRNQIKTIDKEIVLLRERQNDLTAFTKVDDIIHLATLTEYDLDFQSSDDAKQLLRKISDALETYRGEDSAEKNALLRLKTIIQERSDYLPTINYISWVIRIKIRFKKHLSSKRSKVEKEQETLRDDMVSVGKKIRDLTEELDLLAEKVRYYWAKPITYLNSDISRANMELEEEKSKLRKEVPEIINENKELKKKRHSAISEIQEKSRLRKDVEKKLQDMMESHSSDNWEWDRLQRENSSLKSEIKNISSQINNYNSAIDELSPALNSLSTISEKRKERKKWEEKRTRIVGFIRHYDKDFPTGRRIAENDEKNIIVARLAEIQQIREIGIVEAQEAHKKEFDEIKRLHEEKISELEARKQELHTRLQNSESAYSESLTRISLIENKIETAKKTENRFSLFSLFYESPAVTAAKAELEREQEVLAQEEETKRTIISMITELKKESDLETSDFAEKTQKCKPRYLRPTSEEQREEKKLSLRLEEINQQHKEGGHESKN